MQILVIVKFVGEIGDEKMLLSIFWVVGLIGSFMFIGFIIWQINNY